MGGRSRVESITREKVELIKEMGCVGFCIGIESGSEYIRKKVMNRMMSNEMLYEKFTLVMDFDIRAPS